MVQNKRIKRRIYEDVFTKVEDFQSCYLVTYMATVLMPKLY